ncbi:hypothetical protein LWI28_006944 [Acer negundo]|uniref:Pentatricopeptide repeat-containing protein n=1 Tax=Acer negundo TaxID=4023 RepID=A0AAD5NTW9_ACENE|nr:hypothetical protein LWI28_006944 [Acer negundo]
MKHNQCRLMTSGLSLVRRLCTVTVDSVTEKLTGNNDRLYKKLSALGITGRSVEQTLNEYKLEGKVIRKVELGHSIRGLRRYGRFNHALEVMEWMKKRKINFSVTDHALYIDLVAKSKGIAAAENYFNGLPPSAKNRFTYGSLLNCYCRELMTEKALALFEEMDQLNLVCNSLAYNNLMTMYIKLGQPEKVPSLVEQMKQKNKYVCNYTYTIWMQSCAALNDIDGVERVFEELKKDGEDKCTWTTYSNLAAIYIKAELFEKAESALKKLEETKPSDREAYHFLISLYASTCNLEEVNRIWNILKSAFPTTNMSYLVMLQALEKLNAVYELKECFKEWESSCSSYDMRLATTVIRAYLKRDMYDEAVTTFDGAIKRAKGLYFKAREAFMVYYLRTGQLDLAWNEVDTAISEAKELDWKPTEEIIDAFFKFFMEEKDVDGAEDFCRILKSLKRLNTNAYYLLIRTYMAAGKSTPEMRQRLEEDGVEISHKLEGLLARICPEKD